MNSMNKWLSFLVTYLPTILHGVVAVQGAITAKGETKKTILMNAITAGADTASQIPVAHVDGIGKLINVVVTDLKNANIHGFSNDPSPAPATTVPTPAQAPAPNAPTPPPSQAPAAPAA